MMRRSFLEVLGAAALGTFASGHSAHADSESERVVADLDVDVEREWESRGDVARYELSVDGVLGAARVDVVGSVTVTDESGDALSVDVYGDAEISERGGSA